LASLQLAKRSGTVVSKLDRGYEDFVSGRILEEFWTRKSKEWEGELQTADAERSYLEVPRPLTTTTAERILELAKKVENIYKSQEPAEQRRLLETVLSNCTFDRGTLSPSYRKPFDLLVRGNETGDWRREWDSSAFALRASARSHAWQRAIPPKLALSSDASEGGWRRVGFVPRATSGTRVDRSLELTHSDRVRRSTLVERVVHLRATRFGGQPSRGLPTEAHTVGKVSEGWRGVWDEFRNWLISAA
jgi:hypothetical protein